MSTDITLELQSQPTARTFGTYARRELDSITRALSVAIGDGPTATAALTAALRAALEQWDTTQVEPNPDRFIFGQAIAHVIAQRAARYDPTAELAPLLGPAVTVGYFGLNWSIDDLSRTLELSPEAIERHLENARNNGIAHWSSGPLHVDVRHHVRALMSAQDPVAPDVARIERRHRWRGRLRSMKIASCAALGLFGALALIAQFAGQPDPSLFEQVAAASTADDSEANESEEPDLALLPDFTASDGEGGFIGVRSPTARNPQVEFTRSTDRQSWTSTTQWDIGVDASITRFERTGEHYISWIEGVPTTSDRVIGTVGISRDLQAWTVREIAFEDQPSDYLTYQSEIADLSVSGDNILALVTTNVEVDFDAVPASQIVCRRADDGDETPATSSSCPANGTNVRYLADAPTLPERNRLFVSRAGQPFEQVEVPFGTRSAADLATVSGEFAVIDETGMRFATSPDARSWQRMAIGQLPFPVRAAATDLSNDVVGVGDTADSGTVLFHTDRVSATTVTSPLAELVGVLSPHVRAVAASGPDRWAVYLFEPQTKAWLLFSENGVDWTVHTAPLTFGDSPSLLVGDAEAVVQWIDVNNETITFAIDTRELEPN